MFACMCIDKADVQPEGAVQLIPDQSRVTQQQKLCKSQKFQIEIY